MELPKDLLDMMDSLPKGEEAEVIKEVKQTLPLLRVEKDKRKGKTATLITGYQDDCEEIRELAKTLKQSLAVGGSTRDGEILLQGDVREKVAEVLRKIGYKVKVIM